MKKLLLVILSSLFLVIGCASVNSGNDAQKTLDEKYLRISDGFALQMQEKNFTSAYNRLCESYKVIYTEKEFVQKCTDFFPEGKDLSSYKVTFSSTQADFYTVTDIECKFDSEIKNFSLFFAPTENFPVHIMFSKYNKPESKQLKVLAENNFKMGTGMTGYNLQTSAFRCPGYPELTEEQFSSMTSTNLMKPSYVLNQTKSILNAKSGNPAAHLDFSTVDEILSWAQEHNVGVRGHTLVWHTQAPEWFFRKNYESSGELLDRETMIERTELYIRDYMTYCQTKYPGVVYCWDVVNEAVDPGKGDSASGFMCRKENDGHKNFWYYTIGADYPEVAFTIARKYAAPGVKLFYNDYGTIDSTKRHYINKLCTSLKEKGLIDGIGMQGYWDLNYPPMRVIKETLETYAKLGIEIQLTEWSMPVTQENEVEFNRQAERYASIIRLIKKLDTDNGGPANITGITFFGLCDHYPLYPNDNNTTRLWDGKLNPKPVYFAVKDTLGFTE